MKTRFRQRLLTCFAATAAVVLAVSGLTSAAAPESPKKIFHIRYGEDIERLDWTHTSLAINAWAIKNIMEGLLEMDAQGEMQPRLAASYTVSADRESYVFKLRKDIRWSDGAKLKAQHFLDAWKRLLDPAAKNPYASFLFPIRGALAYHSGENPDFEDVGIQALDNETIEVKLSRPTPYFTQMLGSWLTYPIRLDLIEKYGDAWTEPGKLVVLGPFQLASREKGKNLVLTRNDSYYGARPPLDELRLEVIPRDEDALKRFNEGTLEHYWPSALSEVKPRLSRKAAEVSYDVPVTTYLAFDPQSVPLGARKAIAMAVDKGKLVQILGTRAKPTSSFIPETLFPFGRESDLSFNASEARTLLAQSKVHELVFVALDTELNTKILHALSSQISKNLGLHTSVRLLPQEKLQAERSAHRPGEVFLASWTADYFDPQSFLNVFLSESGDNPVHWSDRNYDHLVHRAATLQNGDDRAQECRKALLVLQREQAVVVPLFNPRITSFLDRRVAGLEATPQGDAYFRAVDLVEGQP